MRGGELAALWVGPDEWLIVGPAGTQHALEERLRAAVDDVAATAAVVDVSAQRTTLLVAGPSAHDLLAHGCPLDLHPRAFGAGRCAQTTLARAQVVLVPRDEHKPGFWVLVRSSFAGYLAEWLLDAASEYGQIRLPAERGGSGAVRRVDADRDLTAGLFADRTAV